MKPKISLSILLLFFLALPSIALSVKKQEYNTVMVIMEAKPGKESILQKELINVRNLSRKEPACLEYYVSYGTQNPSLFILYEKWRSSEEHQQQFKKPYVVALGEKLKNLLAKPYKVIHSQEI